MRSYGDEPLDEGDRAHARRGTFRHDEAAGPGGRRVAGVAQGDLYWIDLGTPFGSEPGYRRPFVVIQNDFFNRSGIGTVLACALSTNLRLADAPGNVVVSSAETGLPPPRVVNVSQVATLTTARVRWSMPAPLTRARMKQIVAGLTRVDPPGLFGRRTPKSAPRSNPPPPSPRPGRFRSGRPAARRCPFHLAAQQTTPRSRHGG